MGVVPSFDRLCDHPQVRAISFVGSAPVAKSVYARAPASGKRMQCQGSAKNHVLVLPDADMSLATQIVADSAFGCAGQRCLAGSVAITVGDARGFFRDSISKAAYSLKVGNGLDDGTQMGPVITKESKKRVLSLVGVGVSEGAIPVQDGRDAEISNKAEGNFLSPTILDGLPSSVLSLIHAKSLNEAMEFSLRQPRPLFLRPAARQPADSVMKRPPAISASTSVWPH
jgi:malonate-semialdehyde dehydrogenase (acetylating) / methylmalonate-semialdehyde dehydrogenase